MVCLIGYASYANGNYKTSVDFTITDPAFVTPAPTLSPKEDEMSNYWRLQKNIDLSQWSSIKEMVKQEANFLDMDVRASYITASAESRFIANAKNVNGHNNIDSGAMQLNNGGAPVECYMGKTLKLGDGRSVKVTWKNYKTDARLNINMRLRKLKEYLEYCDGDYFGAYAMYNCGESYGKYLKGKRGALEVIKVLRARGNNQGANNIKNNFWVQYNKYINMEV